MKNAELLNIALCEYGVEETIGGQHNPRILEYFKVAGHEWVKEDELAWCSAFMNFVAINACCEATNKLNARSWLDVGVEVNNPISGDVVILWRKGRNSAYGHVGLYINHHEDGQHINILGGNQNNKVQISQYDKGRVIGYRRLREL